MSYISVSGHNLFTYLDITHRNVWSAINGQNNTTSLYY